MKSKTLFLILSISLGIGSYFVLNHYMTQNKTVEQWIEALQTKNLELFYQTTNIEKLTDNIGEQYSLYSSKTPDSEDTLSNFFNSTKSNLLGFVYKNFTGDIVLIIDSYFSEQKEYTLFYDSDNILGFIKSIDFKKIKYEKINDNLYKVYFFQNTLNKEFSFNIVTEEDSKGKQSVVGISDFHILLSKIEKDYQNYLDFKNDQIKKNINDTLQITFFETKVNNSTLRDGSLNFSIIHNIKIKNLTDKTIFGFKYKIWVYNPDTEQMAEKVISSNQKIYPNMEVLESVNNINPQFHYFVENYNLYPKIEIISIDFLKYQVEYVNKIEWK